MKSAKLRLTIELPPIRRGSLEIEITAALKRSLQQAAQELLQRAVTEEWVVEQYLRFRRQQEQERRNKFDAEQKQLVTKSHTPAFLRRVGKYLAIMGMPAFSK